MTTISRYVVVDADDEEGDWEYDSFDEAKADALEQGDCAVIEREYEYSDSSLVWTPNGETFWPPDKMPE